MRLSQEQTDYQLELDFLSWGVKSRKNNLKGLYNNIYTWRKIFIKKI